MKLKMDLKVICLFLSNKMAQMKTLRDRDLVFFFSVSMMVPSFHVQGDPIAKRFSQPEVGK